MPPANFCGVSRGKRSSAKNPQSRWRCYCLYAAPCWVSMSPSYSRPTVEMVGFSTRATWDATGSTWLWSFCMLKTRVQYITYQPFHPPPPLHRLPIDSSVGWIPPGGPDWNERPTLSSDQWSNLQGSMTTGKFRNIIGTGDWPLISYVLQLMPGSEDLQPLTPLSTSPRKLVMTNFPGLFSKQLRQRTLGIYLRPHAAGSVLATRR